jgi:hypothetical protein
MNLTGGKLLSLAMEVLGKGIKGMEINKISAERIQSNPVDIVMKLRSMGYAFSTVGGFINFTYCRKDNPPYGAIPLLRELKTHRENGWRSKDPCLFCCACGNWPGHDEGLWCFYAAIFLGKSEPARSVTDELRANCPHKEHKGES